MYGVQGLVLCQQLAHGSGRASYAGCALGAARPLFVSLSRAVDGSVLANAQAAQAVSHRHVATVRQVHALDDGMLVVAEDLVPGTSLRELMDRALATGQPLPVEMVLHVVRDVLSGLSAAHLLQGPDGQLQTVLHGAVDAGKLRIGLDGHGVLTGLGRVYAEALPGAFEADVHAVGELAYQALALNRGQPVATTGMLLGNMLARVETRQRLWESCPGLPRRVAVTMERLCSVDDVDRLRTAVDGMGALDQDLDALGGPDHLAVAAWLETFLPGLAQRAGALTATLLEADQRPQALPPPPRPWIPQPGQGVARSVMASGSSPLALPAARYQIAKPVRALALRAGAVAGGAGVVLALLRSCG